LALALAEAQLQHYPHGVWFVELAPVSNPASVPNAVLHALGNHSTSDPHIVLVDFLQNKHALLILDNCEHVIEACAHLVDVVLRGCGQTHILATSREVMGVAGEHVWRVPSLQFTTAQLRDLSALEQCESVDLFVDRAKSVLPNFTLTEANAPAIQQICVHLDGIPLAIELAAARLSSLSPIQIAERLTNRFSLLNRGNRNALPRHQTLQAMIDWSYRLLTEAERKAFRYLAVFTGGWTLEAAEFVCAEPHAQADDVLNQLSQLVGKSLINVDDAGAELHYNFLETIRQYATERLLETGEIDAVRNRHLDYYLDYGKRMAHALNDDHSADQTRLIRQLSYDMANIKQALEWAIKAQRMDDGYSLLERYYILFIARMGRGPEFQGLYASLLAHPAGTRPTYVNAMIHLELGDLHLHLGELDQTRWHYEQARTIGLTLDDAYILFRVEFGCAWHAMYSQDTQQARLHYEAWQQILKRGVNLKPEEIQDNELGFLCELADLEADYVTERNIAAQCYEQAHQLLTPMQTSANARMLGYALIDTGELNLAEERLRESLIDNHALGDKQAVAACLSAFAALARAQQSLIKSARLYGASEALQKSIHVNLVDWDRRRVQRNLAKLQRQLDERTLNTAWAEGRAMSMDQAMAYALDSTRIPL